MNSFLITCFLVTMSLDLVIEGSRDCPHCFDSMRVQMSSNRMIFRLKSNQSVIPSKRHRVHSYVRNSDHLLDEHMAPPESGEESTTESESQQQQQYQQQSPLNQPISDYDRQNNPDLNSSPNPNPYRIRPVSIPSMRHRQRQRKRLRGPRTSSTTTTTTTTTQAPVDDYYEYEDDYDDYDYHLTTTTTTTTMAPKRRRGRRRFRQRPTEPTTTTTTTTLSPNYKPRPDGRIIDYQADPNFPYELKGADLTEYPFYITIPDSNFDCKGRHDGYYADIELKCQVYHHCAVGHQRYDFLCPNYTLFDQTTFTCRFVNTVDCNASESHYNRNNELYIESTTTSTTTAKP